MEVPNLASFERRLRRPHATAEPLGPVPLVVVRIPALEQTAWRAGIRDARRLETRILVAFGDAATRVLRRGDAIAHEPGSDTFLIGLLSPTRRGSGEIHAIDVRHALARIRSMLEAVMRLDVEAGWEAFHPDRDDIATTIESALVRGRQERERYAFFSAIGHELRTPLGSICGYLETLATDELDVSTQRRFSHIAHAEALRMRRLIDGMFDLSLHDLAASFPQHGRSALDVAFLATQDACSSTASARRVSLRFQRLPPIELALDGERLILILVNVVENAIRHGKAGGCVEVGLDSEITDPRFAVVVVDDDGPGIAASDRLAIFAFGARGSTTSSGSGIGLALVRLMLERVGGEVVVERSPLGGARFRVTLPRRLPLEQGARAV